MATDWLSGGRGCGGQLHYLQVLVGEYWGLEESPQELTQLISLLLGRSELVRVALLSTPVVSSG